MFNLEVWQQDVTHACIQGPDMQRDVYVEPAAQFQ